VFYLLYEWLGPVLRAAGWYDLNVVRYVSFRAAVAMVTAFVLVYLLGPWVIRRLIKLKIGDRPEFYNETLNKLTADKKNVPTMGGLLIIAAVVGACLLWGNPHNPYLFLAVFTMVWLGALGFADDWLKLEGRKLMPPVRDGLKSWEKLLFQLGLGVIVTFFLMEIPDFASGGTAGGPALWLPITKVPVALSAGVFMVAATLFIAGFSNAVNLTDGMDGLAAGCMTMTSLTFIVLCYIAGEVFWISVGPDQIAARYWADFLNMPRVPGAQELCVFCAAVTGACLGFLWFNCHPAQVFMGDTGSLALGGSIAYVAVATRNEWLLILIGGVFILEMFSVMLQVGYYKWSGGKRIFRMAPIHHHFQLGATDADRQPEQKVVVRFWLAAAVLAALGLAAVKLR
jgi:phospho-N-acetylmuramoyl-pentapeptide-transferase